MVWEGFLQEMTLELGFEGLLDADWVKRDETSWQNRSLREQENTPAWLQVGGSAGCWAKGRCWDAAAAVSQGQADGKDTLLIDFQ